MDVYYLYILVIKKPTKEGILLILNCKCSAVACF